MTQKKKNIHFTKYQTISGDYHYQYIKKSNFKDYNAAVISRFQIEIQFLKSYINQINRDKLKILDVGCGDSVLFYLFNKTTKSQDLLLYGIDNSEIALSVARKKNPKVNYYQAEVNNLPFENNFFDIIVSFDVIEHVINPEEMLREMIRVCKNNGALILGTPIKYNEAYQSRMHAYEYFPSEFNKLLNNYLEDVKIYQFQKLIFRLIYNYSVKILNKKIRLFRYFINFISIFLHRNFFFIRKKNDNSAYSYMIGTGVVKKF
jgi:ubiquinone/menaquinone biosynthesis C-methylase UbiE